MKKVRGKALALVLSIALVVSSFSAIPASAASRSEKAADIDGEIVDQYLVNGGTTKDSLTVEVSGGTTATLITKKHRAVDADLVALSHSSGSSLVKWNDFEDEGSLELTLRSSSVKPGTETLKALYKGTYQDEDENDITVTYTDSFDVTVFDNNSVVIGEVGTYESGDDARLDTTFAQKTLAYELSALTQADSTLLDKKNLTVYQARHGATDAKVTWTALKTEAKPASDDSATTKAFYTLKSSSTKNIGLATASDAVTATVGENAGTGSVTFTAEITDYGKVAANYVGADAPSDQDDIKAKTSVTKTINVDAKSTSSEAGYVNFGKYRGYNYLYNTSIKDSAIKVTGYDVHFASNGNKVKVADNASIDTISGSVASVDVTDGTVSTINIAAGDVTVTGEDAKANSITTAAGDVEVSGKATAGDIDGGDGTDDTVTVSGSKAGNITAIAAYIKAEDEESTTTVGNITAGLVDIESVDSKGLTVGTITSNAPDATVNVSGNDIKLGGFDFDYYNTVLTVDDYQGAIPAPQNADVEGTQIITNNSEDVIEITGDLNIDTITLADESKVTLDGKATVLTIEGAGTLVINAGDLSGLASVSGTTLKLADPNIKPDEKVFTAISDSVDVDDFTPYGFTLKKTTGSSVDTFYVDQPEFRGLEINKTSSSIANGYSETFTASAYPTGTSFPAEYVGVQWSIDNEDKFELTKNDNGSVTVKAINYDPDFVSENKGTLKAELVDESGEVADEDEYAPGEATLTVIEKPLTTYKSDTTGNVALGLGQTYQFKITSLDGKPVTFAVASKGATVTLANASGNDYYYKVTGAKLGNYGVYVNADKTPVAVLNITSNVKIDTPTVTIASGKTYQFKVTAPAQPTFQVAGLGTIALAQKTGNDYFYKVTANNVKGGHGVYVNGARLAIATFA